MKATQKSELLKKFKRGIWISQVKAFEMVGTTRLSAYIFVYKEEGMTFTKRKNKITNRYGNTTFITEYKLNK